MWDFFKIDRNKVVSDVSNGVVCNLTSGEYSDLEVAKIVLDIKERSIVYLKSRNIELTSELDSNNEALKKLWDEKV